MTTRRQELRAGTNMRDAGQNPFETGVVSNPAYSSMFAAPQNTFQSLSGETIRADEFGHNNMQPYFSGSVRQSVDPDVNASRLENFTGSGALHEPKQEVACFFEPTGGMTNVCGFMENKNDFYLNRIELPKAQNNIFPIDQVRVGPGLGKGYTDKPDGGFQQSSTLDYIRPKTVDELRVATKPKTSFKMPAPATKVGTFQRGLLPNVTKNRPDTCYEQTEDQLFKTTGAYTKATSRPSVIDVKPTARVDTHGEYKGNATANSTKPGKGTSDDYGKKGVQVYNNSRELTGSHSVVTNVTSAVKAIVAPLLDVFRNNLKEYTIDASREFGNMHAQIPEKATTYDPVNHIMKTTIKETTIHDTTINNLTGKTRGPMAALDETKKTVRQTLPVEDVVRNVAAHKYNVTVYNCDEVARTTVRQTTKLSGSMFGYIGGKAQDSAGAYSVIDVDMKDTQKQYVSDYEYEGIAGSKADFRPKSSEAEYNAEIDGTREAINIAAGHTPNGAGGFTGQDPAKFDMESKRLVSDSIVERTTANARPQQVTARAIDACEVTKSSDFLNGGVNRLDSSILASLRSNPYSININPVVDCNN